MIVTVKNWTGCGGCRQNLFLEEVESLKGEKQLSKRIKLVHLNPEWDKRDEVIRVGGQLQRSLLPHESCKPIILR